MWPILNFHVAPISQIKFKDMSLLTQLPPFEDSTRVDLAKIQGNKGKQIHVGQASITSFMKKM